MTVEVFRFLDAEDAPQWCLPVTRDAVRQALEADVLQRIPQIDSTVPQPLSNILDLVASYIHNTSLLHNNAGNMTVRRFATGAALVLRAAEVGVTPNPGESDESIRQRADAAALPAASLTYSGLERAALLSQYSAMLRSVAFQYVPATGTVQYTLLGSDIGDVDGQPRGTPTAALIAGVGALFSSAAVAPLGVRSFAHVMPTITPWYMTIQAELLPGAPSVVALITTLLEQYIGRTYALGNQVTQQSLYRALNSVPGADLKITRLNIDDGAGLDDIKARTDQEALLGVIGEATGNTITIVES
ncbi:MAG: hypothetical protein OXC69_03265 [Candidatus Tectomicrobia bacterium]|nr:hypothetical protein [Candidatus Tectomicrobia bacterium]